LTHLDAHQHIHLWPPVCGVVLELALRFDVPAVRVPRFRSMTPSGIGVTVLGRRLARRAAAAGLRYPEDAVGIECAGCLDRDRLPKVLARLAAGTRQSVELTAHPGEGDDADRARYAWGYQWEDELVALGTPEARELVTRHGFT